MYRYDLHNPAVPARVRQAAQEGARLVAQHLQLPPDATLKPRALHSDLTGPTHDVNTWRIMLLLTLRVWVASGAARRADNGDMERTLSLMEITVSADYPIPLAYSQLSEATAIQVAQHLAATAGQGLLLAQDIPDGT